MKCPECGYTSFPYLESCAKCGHEQTEQRRAFGIYALRHEPPDLLLAYQAANMEVAGATLAPPLSTPGIDLGQLDEIEVELGEAEPADPSAPEEVAQTGAAADLIPAPDLESTAQEEHPPAEPSLEPVSAQDIDMPQTLDLSELGGITLELETAEDLGSQSPGSAQPPRQAPESKPVYDLDLDEDLEDLPLGSSVNEPDADDEDEENSEYTLEIEDELEFEIGELEIEEDDEAEEGDDDR